MYSCHARWAIISKSFLTRGLVHLWFFIIILSHQETNHSKTSIEFKLCGKIVKNSEMRHRHFNMEFYGMAMVIKVFMFSNQVPFSAYVSDCIEKTNERSYKYKYRLMSLASSPDMHQPKTKHATGHQQLPYWLNCELWCHKIHIMQYT